MSSFSENLIPGSDFLPPESAQLPQSLFGGPSSDVGQQPSSQPEPPRSSLFAGPFSQYAILDPVPESEPMDEAPDGLEDEHDTIMRERQFTADNDSDADSFHGSERRGRRRSRRNLSSGPVEYGPPAESSQASMNLASEPIQYIINRGLDLPPGTERPNLFEGAPNSWRNYNADDIGTYEAMITDRGRDLSAHLYNSYVLRRRMEAALQENPSIDENTLPLMPKRWTAWPDRAAKVPRLDETLRNYLDDPGTMYMAPDPRPSANLEESISTLMLKTAKEKYQAREWDYEEIKNDMDEKVNDEDSMETENPEDPEDSEDLETKEHLEPVVSAVMRPIIQADDEKSYQQVRPLARSIISQVDKLLYGLHCAMKGRMYEDDCDDEVTEDEDEDEEYPWDSWDEDEYGYEDSDEDEGEVHAKKMKRGGEEEEEEEDEQPQVRNLLQQTKRHGSRSLSRTINARASAEKDAEDERLSNKLRDGDESCDFEDSEDDISYLRAKRNLRDWSEVLGLAGMMDISATAVMRASKRCADLFGEDMEFHTMTEGRVKKRRNKDGEWRYTYTESETDTEDDMCPPSPSRNSRSISQPDSKSRSRSRTAPITPSKKRSKKYKTPALVPASGSSSPAPGSAMNTLEPLAPTKKQPSKSRPGLGKGAHRKVDLVCPLENCPRHTNGFSRTWNLNQHMKKAHPSYVPPPAEESNERGAVTPGNDGIIEVD
ncbi:uncharacterized protein N7529_008195 [Penicillium soppii]|uniref:uncharacterized protein n=1 Tax=Penicillium soppii TaxID=69789 RepID=UPI002546A769|nr:uncharacterized protein N7529_008195 [Penicillium soppii]KAJ5860885.1 hypothetical protein N7529_008195 [Penicillium soppii]